MKRITTAAVLGLMGNSLFHDKCGHAELFIEPLGDRHATREARRGGSFRVEQFARGRERSPGLQEPEETLGERGVLPCPAVFGRTLEVFRGFGVVETESLVSGKVLS